MYLGRFNSSEIENTLQKHIRCLKNVMANTKNMIIVRFMKNKTHLIVNDNCRHN